MEKKSQIYDQMKRGDYSGITDAQLAELPFEVRHLALLLRRAALITYQAGRPTPLLFR